MYMNVFFKHYSYFLLDFHSACKAKSLLHVSMIKSIIQITHQFCNYALGQYKKISALPVGLDSIDQA